ncbi:uncharacterized protein BX663DRAFT_351832 [Cokeromyces recurvatus]|uniref:uncharacterized protein n=1 Tax=Cokeromyces recurvatus TaxID=90255 RepID=UPI00221FF9A7|nr:uncharacterized protein BX663DRAFT_351832 [Cokeromyces recurvatus]KAI7903989.1 hypothetical protein BX663DRAFT_351832 [Cokeromyces recurvatus]
MSQGPPRPYPSHNYPAIQNNSMPRQQQIINNQQAFEHTLITSSPPAMTHVQTTNSSASAGSNSTNTNSPNNTSRGITTTPLGSTQETLYCDSCQTFRHISFFQEREFKYKVCNLCHTRELQKRKHQLERYELYEEHQRNYKQARYQNIQYNAPQQQQLSPQQQLHSSTSININNNAGGVLPPPPSQSISSPQTKQSSSATSVMPTNNGNVNNSNNNKHINRAHMFTPPIVSQAHMHSQQMMQSSIPLPLPNQQSQSHPQQLQSQDLQQIPQHQLKHEHLLQRLDKSNMINNSNTQRSTVPTTNASLASSSLPSSVSIMAPANASLAQNQASLPSTIRHKSSSSTSAEKASQEIISLERFVKELEKETEFDRKQYHLDIGQLIDNMGENPNFTQLGRSICERVLEGTKFNFR